MADEVLKKLQVLSRERRLRWADLFADFDLHNNKRVTKSNFERGVSCCGAKLNDDEIAALVDRFNAGDGMVDAGAFCDHVELAHTAKGLEKEPMYNWVDPLDGVKPNAVLCPATAAQVDNVYTTAMYLLCKKVKTENITLKRFWVDFDRHRCGTVTRAQFIRGLAMLLSSLDSDYQDALCDAYTTVKGDVHYRSLVQDIDEMIAKEKIRNSLPKRGNPLGLSEINGVDALDVEACVASMRQIVQNHGLGVHQLFIDLDEMRTGLITRSKFKSSLERAFGKYIPLNDNILAMLTDRYSSMASFEANLEHARIVKYGEFEDDVDPAAAHVRDLHQNPSKDSQYMSRSLSKPVQVRDEDYDHNALSRIMELVRTRRLNIAPCFFDFDRLHRGVITESQFKRVLTLEFQALKLSEHELDCIAERFAHSEHGIEYSKFVKYVESGALNKKATPRATKSCAPLQQGTLERPAPTHAEVVAMLQRKVKSLGIRLHEFLVDHDRTKHGIITVSQFSQGLSRARVHLTEGQITALTEPYVDSSGTQLYWRDLLRHIDSVEYIAGLETQPTHSGTTMVPRAKKIPYIEKASDDSEEDREVEEILELTRAAVWTNRVLMLPAFKVHDKHNSGKLDEPLFRRALETFALRPLRNISEEMMHRIAQQFSSGMSSFGYVVNYRAFVDAISSRPAFLNKSNNDQEGKRRTRSGANNNNNDDDDEDQNERKTHSSGQSRAEQMIASNSIGANRSSRMPSPRCRMYGKVLKRLQDQAWARGVRVRSFLEDFDRLRKGNIPEAKFTSALMMAGLTLDAIDMSIIKEANRSEADPELINYTSFVAELDGDAERLEVNPSGSPYTRVPRPFIEAQEYQPVDPKLLHDVLAPIRQRSRIRNLNLLDSFKHRDRRNLKSLTVNQFASVLKTHNLLPLDSVNEVMEVIHSAFPARHPENINYVNFLNEL